jgi:hypothetical protein
MKDDHKTYKTLNNSKIPYKFDSRYIFEDSLSRIFRLINEVKSLEEFIKKQSSLMYSQMTKIQFYLIII